MEINWKSIRNQLEINWKSIRNQLEINWKLIGNQLEISWKSVGNQLEINWKSVGNQLEISWKSIGNQLEINWKSKITKKMLSKPLDRSKPINWKAVHAEVEILILQDCAHMLEKCEIYQDRLKKAHQDVHAVVAHFIEEYAIYICSDLQNIICDFIHKKFDGCAQYAPQKHLDHLGRVNFLYVICYNGLFPEHTYSLSVLFLDKFMTGEKTIRGSAGDFYVLGEYQFHDFQLSLSQIKNCKCHFHYDSGQHFQSSIMRVQLSGSELIPFSQIRIYHVARWAFPKNSKYK